MDRGRELPYSSTFDANQDLEREFLSLNARATAILDENQATEMRLATLRRDHSDLHPSVVAANKTRIELLDKIRSLNTDGLSLLGGSLEIYVSNLKQLRPEHVVQKRLNRRIVQLLAELTEVTGCFDWSNAEAQNETWRRFGIGGTNLGTRHEYSAHLRKLAIAEAERKAQMEREAGGRAKAQAEAERKARERAAELAKMELERRRAEEEEARLAKIAQEEKARRAMELKQKEDSRQRHLFLTGTPQERSVAAAHLQESNLLTEALVQEALPALRLLLVSDDNSTREFAVSICEHLNIVRAGLVVDLANASLQRSPDTDGSYGHDYDVARANEWEAVNRRYLALLLRLGPDAAPAEKVLAKAVQNRSSSSVTVPVLRALQSICGLSPEERKLLNDVLVNPNDYFYYAQKHTVIRSRVLFPKSEDDVERVTEASYKSLDRRRIEAIQLIIELESHWVEFVPTLRELVQGKGGSGAGLYVHRSDLIMVAAIDALGKIGTHAAPAIKDIEKMLTHENKEVREAAVTSLRAIRGEVRSGNHGDKAK